MKYKLSILVLLFLLTTRAHAQKDSINYDVELSGLSSSGTFSPFWFQNNSYGKIVSKPSCFNLFASFNKEFARDKKFFDYGFKATFLVQQSDRATKVYFHELYAKTRLSVFDLIVGARQEHIGNQDSTLSCGGFLFSHNARPIPKITVGIEHFIPVRMTNGFLEIRGAIAHGWFNDGIGTRNSYLHHKYFYGRLGGKLPVHIQYGLEHAVQWGGTHPTQGKQPAGLKNFINIFAGRSGGSDANWSDQINTLGNHIISQGMKLEVDVMSYNISAYWQNISEDTPIKFVWNSMNREDGLWGLCIRNRKSAVVSGILYEFLNTTDQSGPFHDKDGIIYGGSDSYFRNGAYPQGWSYFGRTIGTPFISSPSYNQDGGICTINSRVKVHHVGVEGAIFGYNYRLLSSFHKNYGNVDKPLPNTGNNTSLMLEVKKNFPKLANIECGVALGADFGKYYGNTVGCVLSVRKSGFLFGY